ncbi:MAG: recombination regulator RecX [Treponema sp.]|nr:recombination regulator RecX [Treponema sp.]
MEIIELQETSYKGMYKIKGMIKYENAPCQISSFFVRQEYLKSVEIISLKAGDIVSSPVENELLDAGIISLVELKAVDYLARAEQCRFGLTRKLMEKGYEKDFINNALDYLEKVNYLSDERFSQAWLNSRKLNHYEGRIKLLAELQTRGINKEIATDAVNTFFMENDELEICCKAYEKFLKKGKTDEKLVTALLNAGFSYKMIKAVQDK